MGWLLENFTKPGLLVVDDEPGIRDNVKRYFESNGFHAFAAGDCASALTSLERHAIDVVLLDIGLPDQDGLSLTRHLRQHWHGALIIVSGRSDLVERVAGLESGADDYVSKPFELRELLARVRSVLRRVKPLPARPLHANGVVFEFAGLTLDVDGHQLATTEGRDIPLTTGEFDMLLVLLEQPGKVITRDHLMQRLHGRPAGPFDRAVDVQVGRLRRKVEADPGNPTLIKSIRGAGYVLAAPVRRR